MEAVLLRGLDQSASRATSSVERANESVLSGRVRNQG
jgi:hypothetical protein